MSIQCSDHDDIVCEFVCQSPDVATEKCNKLHIGTTSTKTKDPDMKSADLNPTLPSFNEASDSCFASCTDSSSEGVDDASVDVSVI